MIGISYETVTLEVFQNPATLHVMSYLMSTIAGGVVWKALTKLTGKDGSTRTDVYIGSDQGKIFQAKGEPINYTSPSEDHVHAVYNAKGTSGTIDYLRDSNMKEIINTATGMGLEVGRLSKEDLVEKIADHLEANGSSNNK